MRHLAVSAVLGVLTCSSATGAEQPLSIRFELDASDVGGCASRDCGDFGLGCGAMLSVRIVDAVSGELMTSVCEPVAPSASLCDLASLDANALTLPDLPTARVRVEIAAWRPEVLQADPRLAGDCPSDDLFDLRGAPLLTFDPQPAFAGATYVDLATEDTSVTVPLTCSNPDQIDGLDCETTATRVTATIDDIDGLLPITSDQAERLRSVSIAEPSVRIDQVGQSIVVLRPGDSFELTRRSSGPLPTYEASLERTFGDVVCVQVLEDAAQATTSVECTNVPRGATELAVTGIHLPKGVLDDLLSAVGESSFPPEGLVVGRVVDHTGQALAQVAVSPLVAGADVRYLTAQGDSTTTDHTSNNGYFIARNVPFGTAWQAEHVTDGRRNDNTIAAGMVEGKALLTIVEMEAP